MDTIIFVESNTTGTGEILAELATARGCRVLFLVDNPEKYDFISDFSYLRVDTASYDKVAAVTDEIQIKSNVVAVMSTSEYYVETASRLANHLRLPSLNPDVIKHCRDKYVLRQMIRGQVGKDVQCALITSRDEIAAKVPDGWYPVVVKPRSGSGSSAVQLCRNESELSAALSAVEEFSRSQNALLGNPGCLVEEYVEGQEYSVECFHGSVIGVVRKHIGEVPYFVEIGHDFNIDVNDTEEEIIRREVARLLELMELTWGPVHIELKYENREVRIIEVNPRLAGGMIPVLIDSTLGINLVKAWLDIALNKVPELCPMKDVQGAIRFLVPSARASVRRTIDAKLIADALADIDAPINVVEAKLYREVGESVMPRGDFKDRIGHVIAVADELDMVAVQHIRDYLLGEVLHVRS